MMITQAVILAGGKGTRLREISAEWGEIPKPMVPLAGKPILEHQIDWARKSGIKHVLVLVQHQAQKIRDHFADFSGNDFHIQVEEEPEPIGTSGAVLRAAREGWLEERFWILYGDTVFNISAEKMIRAHLETSADATLFLHPNDHPFDSDLVEVDVRGWITRFHPYPRPEAGNGGQAGPLANLVNAALYIVERSALEGYSSAQSPVAKSDFGKDLFPWLLKHGAKLWGYRSPEYVKDMGTPERLRKVQKDWSLGRVGEQGGWGAVFLDRDGTLNARRGYVRNASMLELLPGVAEGVRRLNSQAYRTAVVTNQPVIARGECTEQQLQAIHNQLESLLGKAGAYIDRVYYCPHHPDAGFPGELPEFKVPCACRKPGAEMLKQAQREMDLDFSKSWMIGDSTVDVAAAQSVGVRSILLRTGEAGGDQKCAVRADFECMDFLDAVDLIENRFDRWSREAEKIGVDPGSCVLVGGLARSGKSEFSSALKYVLKNRGIRAHVVALDGWLRPGSSRTDHSLEGRFDFAAIGAAVEQVVTQGDSGETILKVPVYDRARRRTQDKQIDFKINKDDVVIFEGVVGLELPVLRSHSTVRIWIQCNETVRKERFLREYEWRGESDRAESLYQQREQDEHPRLLESRAHATYFIGEPTDGSAGGA